MVSERLLRLKTGAIDETRELFGIFIYFWVLLSLFSLHKALVLNEESLIYHQGFALINALALAKVVLVAEYFHVGDNLKNRPLIYPIMFKSAVFAVPPLPPASLTSGNVGDSPSPGSDIPKTGLPG
jgi:hypothetical protein